MHDDFDPNAAPGPDAGIFGLPFARERCRLVLLPVPWDLTTSYRAGTAHGPALALQASAQIDLFDLELGKAYNQGYFLEPIPASCCWPATRRCGRRRIACAPASTTTRPRRRCAPRSTRPART